ncbi:hypothetical protein KAI30_00160, partial [Candidatus Bathyarchaeota archaeon]|nr:hypothetical protein [Candidatus Bathyarchaeota archaeon]
MGEPLENLEKFLIIKQQLEHALAFAYPVKVVFKSGREAEGLVCHTRTNVFSMESVGGDYQGYGSVEGVIIAHPAQDAPNNAFDFMKWRFEYNSVDMGE